MILVVGALSAAAWLFGSGTRVVAIQPEEEMTVEVTGTWSEKTAAVVSGEEVSGGPAAIPLLIQGNVIYKQQDAWKLMLVNKENPLPENYQIATKRLDNGLLVDERIYEPLMEMLNAGNEAGCGLLVCSAYRSYERQVELYTADVKKYQSMGYSYEKACELTEQTLTVPGTSEHQAGLAVDIVTWNHQVLNEAYANTKAGQWLAEHAHEYGFILRYPKEKEDITGILYEPWHFRYVGKEAAAIIRERGVCLEEYLEPVEFRSGNEE